jgi:hypothetical protein
MVFVELFLLKLTLFFVLPFVWCVHMGLIMILISYLSVGIRLVAVFFL